MIQRFEPGFPGQPVRLPRQGCPAGLSRSATRTTETGSRDDLRDPAHRLAPAAPCFSGAPPDIAEIAPHPTRKRR